VYFAADLLSSIPNPVWVDKGAPFYFVIDMLSLLKLVRLVTAFKYVSTTAQVPLHTRLEPSRQIFPVLVLQSREFCLQDKRDFFLLFSNLSLDLLRHISPTTISKVLVGEVLR
jgi:hypothetical protein